MIVRDRNADGLLHAWAAEQVGQPYVWGETDCASLARTACRLAYGAEVWPGIAYTTAVQAVRYRQAQGDVAAHLERAGAGMISPGFAHCGDILVRPDGACGVCLREVVLTSHPDTGVRLDPMAAWSELTATCWRLPPTLEVLHG